jgi:hypothetical protein
MQVSPDLLLDPEDPQVPWRRPNPQHLLRLQDRPNPQHLLRLQDRQDP